MPNVGKNQDMNFSTQEVLQEGEYTFPYHYADLYFEMYRELYSVDYVSMLNVITAMVQPFEGQKLLDAGCGDGRFCYELRNENIEVTGIDYSRKAIGFAKAFNDDGEFCQADLTKVEYSQEFHIVALVEVLEHFPPEIVPVIIKNLWNALKPEGRLIISVPTDIVPVSEKHYQHFTKDKIESYVSPLFEPVKYIGHTKGGKALKRYLLLIKYGELLWRLRRKPGVSWFFKYINRYFKKHVEFCEVEDATRVIGVFKKMPE